VSTEGQYFEVTIGKQTHTAPNGKATQSVEASKSVVVSGEMSG